MNSMSIVGIAGSLRARSYNRQLLDEVGERMPQNMCLRMSSLAAIPLYNEDVEARGIPEAVQQLADVVAKADGLVIASPEYNFSISGVLKNAIDWLSRVKPQPLKDKPVALLSATAGPVGGARHQYELRKVLGCLEACVLPRPEIFIGACHEKFDADGRLIDPKASTLITEQMRAFAQCITLLRASA